MLPIRIRFLHTGAARLRVSTIAVSHELPSLQALRVLIEQRIAFGAASCARTRDPQARPAARSCLPRSRSLPISCSE